jgi:hypothetical protein
MFPSMKKRFSTKAFILATLIHSVATWLMWMQSERAYAEWKRTRVEVVSTWDAPLAWILQPVGVSMSYYNQHHPTAVNAFDNRLNPTHFILPWIVFVGLCFGFLIPRLSRWRVSRMKVKDEG